MVVWDHLEHAYGSASDVPDLLARLVPDPQADVWGELWSRLCHQGTVYSASFAALPVLADTAERWDPSQRAVILALAAAILTSEDVDGSLEAFLRSADGVVPRFQSLCEDSFAETHCSRVEFIYLLQAAFAFDGDTFWGCELDHFADGEFPGKCPHCDVDLYLVIGEHGLFTTADEWILRTSQGHNAIQKRPEIHSTPILPNAGELPDVGIRMRERALAARQDEVALWIDHLFGSTTCPACSQPFAVQDAILRS